MNILIETPRLYIRELMATDDEGMFLMDKDPEVHRYVGQKPINTIEESRAVIEMVRKQYTDNGIGRWAVLEKGTDTFLGWTGFKLMKEEINGHSNFYDFGYRLTRHAWGKGIATESGRAALEYGIKTMGFRNVHAMTDVANGASRHILEKLGFQFETIFECEPCRGWRTQEDIRATWYTYPDPI